MRRKYITLQTDALIYNNRGKKNKTPIDVCIHAYREVNWHGLKTSHLFTQISEYHELVIAFS